MRKIDNMDLRTKLLIYFIGVSVISLVPGIIATVMLSQTPSNNTLVSILIAAMVVIFLISICMAVYSSNKIKKPVEELTKAAARMGKGDLSMHINYNSNDELGGLAKTLNSTFGEIKVAITELIRVLDGLASGDLTVKSDYVWLGDWGELNIALQRITSSLNSLFSNIRNASDQTTNGADQVASAAQALAQGATEQASSIQELSATITEISEHVKNNAANATDADKASIEEEEKLQDASVEMDEMAKAMAEISETSQKIGNIIKTIDDIAFQTNILALNAAVEAARAGEAGKGFAVVADEVRNLASKSAEAAKDTTSLIESSIKAVAKGTKVADSTEKTLTDVMESAGHANQLVNEIAKASNQQATSIGQITEGIQQISSVVQTNSATAEQSAAASEELAAQAKELKHSISHIKLKGQSASSVKNELEVAPKNKHLAKKPSAAAMSHKSDDKYI